MNRNLFIKFLLLTSFLVLGSFSQVQAQESLVGVNVGDSFNYKVTANDFSSSQTGVNISDLISYYNFSQITLGTNYDFDSVIQSLNASLIPSVNDVFGVTVTQLPGSSSSGAVSFNYGSATKDVTTGFMVGTPVTTLNWTYWHDFVYELSSSTTDPTIVPGVYSNAQTFNATLTLTYSSVPQVLADKGFSQLSLDIEVYYDATTGVLNQEIFVVTASNPSVSTLKATQTFSFERTDQALSSNQDNTSSNGSGPVPGFESVAALGSFVVLALYVNRKRR